MDAFTMPKQEKPPSFGKMDLSFTNNNEEALMSLFNQPFFN